MESQLQPRQKNKTGWRKFFFHDLWRWDFSGISSQPHPWLPGWQIWVILAKRLGKESLWLRASALTYTSFLAMVPLLAILFAVLKLLGIQRRLEPLVLERMTVWPIETLTRIFDAIDRVRVGSLGIWGLILTALTILPVLVNLQAAFDEIWGIELRRSVLRKSLDYLALGFIMPLFFFVALSLTATFKSTTLVLWMWEQPGIGPIALWGMRCLPFFAMWVFFTLLFLLIPNVKVRYLPALGAGILTGTCWQLVQWVYISSMVKVSITNIFYGAFAPIPITFIWLYSSWVISILGSEIAFAFQYGMKKALVRDWPGQPQ